MYCKRCKNLVDVQELEKRLFICDYCGEYFQIDAINRIKMIDEEGTFDYLNIKSDFINRNNKMKEQEFDENCIGKIDEAIVIGEMFISGVKTAIGVMDTSYMMASMGYYVGECVTYLFEYAKKKKSQ